MNPLFNILANHLLTIVEYELQKNEPEITSFIMQEVQLLINKLESCIKPVTD